MFRRLLAAALLLGALVLPAAAHAAGPTAGLVATVPMTEAQYQLIADSHVSDARVFMYTANYDDTGFRLAIARLNGMGIRPVVVVVGDVAHPPSDPSGYASFVAARAAEFRGQVSGWEIWNEEDAPGWWAGAPDIDGTARDAAGYTALLKASYAAIRGVDPTTPVVMGGLTGNDYRFLSAVYAAGGGGSFDVVATHTDTACNLLAPSSYYRDPDGRISQFSFLGYREVHAVMAGHGDGAKPIWMTELGWSTSPQTCDQGRYAGAKAGGVSEADQAAFTAQAFHCLAQDSYVQKAIVFRLSDGPDASPFSRFGVTRYDGTTKPAFDALSHYALFGDTLTGPCGDFDPPTLAILSPKAGARVPKALTIKVTASDPSGVPRLTLQADGRKIRNFTSASAPDTLTGAMTWMGAKKLRPGRHTLTLIALDKMGNTATQSVTFTKVVPKAKRKRRRHH